MNIPQGFLEIAIASTVAFVFKVVFGLISKNENKSDEADLRIESEIRDLRKELKETEQRFRLNDREIYGKLEIANGEIKSLKSRLDCLKGK